MILRNILLKGGINKKIKATDINIIATYKSRLVLSILDNPQLFAPVYNYFFRNGFIEYQVIFDKNDYLKAINEIEYLLQANNYSSYMSSFKAYKASNSKYLFGLEKNGFCITLDIPFEKGKKFQYFVRKLNEITIKYNGQVYLGKTPCINNEEFKTMYKNYPEFKKLKIYYDPNFLLVSEMTNRLFSDFYNHKC